MNNKMLNIIAFFFPILGFIMYFSKRDVYGENSDIFFSSIYGLIFEIIIGLIFVG